MINNPIYVTPDGTKVPHDVIAQLRYAAREAGLISATDDWLTTQIRVMVWVHRPRFWARERMDHTWIGWVVPCEPGQGIPVNFTLSEHEGIWQKGDAIEWGWPVRRDGSMASPNGPEYLNAQLHIQAAWTLYMAKMVDVCSNCHGHKGLAECSGFWADVGKPNPKIITSPFKRAQMHFPCPVCNILRNKGKAAAPDWGVADLPIDLDTL